VKPDYRILLRLMPYLRPHWAALLAGTLLAFVVSGAEGLIAWLVKPVMDGIFLRRDLFMLKVIDAAGRLRPGPHGERGPSSIEGQDGSGHLA